MPIITRRTILSVLLLIVVTYTIFISGWGNDEVLFQEKDVFVVRCGRGLICLKFESPTSWRQSVVKPGDPDTVEMTYNRATLIALLFLKTDFQRMLIVGLGGGSIPNYVFHHYPQTKIDVAEIKPIVVQLAKQYFQFDTESPRVSVFTGPGKEFIEYSTYKYDFIVIDGGPQMSGNINDLKIIREHLNDDGVAVISSYKNDDFNQAKIARIQSVFKQVIVLETNQVNVQILALKTPVEITEKSLKERAKKLQEVLRTSIDFPGMVNLEHTVDHISVLSGLEIVNS